MLLAISQFYRYSTHNVRLYRMINTRISTDKHPTFKILITLDIICTQEILLPSHKVQKQSHFILYILT